MVILITHRLYNLKIADYLYVMEEKAGLPKKAGLMT